MQYFMISPSGDLEIKERITVAGTTFTVDVTVTDAAGHTDTQKLVITMLDVNDNAPKCDQNVYEVTIQEGSGGTQMFVLLF